MVSEPFEAGLPEATRRLATGWLAFAVASLGASTLFALLLIASRTPGVGALLPAHDFFYPALVLHVDLAFVVWVLGAGAAVSVLTCPPRAIGVGWMALALGATGAALMALGTFPGGTEAVMSNYVPVLRSKVFLAGLGMFGGAATLMAIRTLVLLRPWRVAPEERAVAWAVAGAALGIVLAAVATGSGIARIPPGLDPAAYFELIMWGPGHILQVANVLLMLAAWFSLARLLGIAAPLRRHWPGIVVVLGIGPLLAAAALLAHEPTSPEYRSGFTAFMRWGTWLAAAPIGLAMLWGLARMRKAAAPVAGLTLSLLLFAAGVGIGTLIRADNVMVPAHYHGTIGAVTLALMALWSRRLPDLGYQPLRSGLAWWQPRLYGGGTLLMAAGLAVSGSMGVGRKLPGDIQALADSGGMAAMGVAGLGGALAVAGSLLFVIGLLATLGGRAGRVPVAAQARGEAAPRESPRRPADRRLLAAAVTAGLVVMLGSLLSVLPGSGAKPLLPVRLPDARSDPHGHVASAREQEIAARFEQAVAMLHAKQYEYAIAALHRIIELRPEMPEAHVNMGYALLGMERYQAAYDFFEGATVLNPMQFNAYYGMAVALEGMGDLEGAMGAMRTYVHLSKGDDPHRRKAEAALWQWESELAARRQAGGEAPKQAEPGGAKRPGG